MLWAMSLQVIEKASGYVILAVMARVLLKADLGAMFFALSVSGLVAIALNFGTDTYLIRRVAGDPKHGMDHFSRVLSLRISNSLICYCLLNLFIWLVRPELTPVMLLVSAYDFLEEIYQAFASFFVAQKQIIYRLLTLGGFKILGMFVISFVAYTGRSLVPILWTYLLIDMALVATVFLVTQRNFGKIRFHWKPSAYYEIFRLALPFFLVNTLTLMHMRFDTIMIGTMLGFQQLANYELGIKLVEVTRFIVRPLGNVFLPIFVEYTMKSSWHQLRRRFLQLILFTALIGILLATVVQLFAKELIEFLFGPNYLESVAPTRILFISVPFLYAGLVLNIVGNALHVEGKIVWTLFLAVLINVGLNVFIIPEQGISGAAWVTVISQIALTLGMLIVVIPLLLHPPEIPMINRNLQPDPINVEDVA